jgi:TatA/E family protein of Tat protein translocase
MLTRESIVYYACAPVLFDGREAARDGAIGRPVQARVSRPTEPNSAFVFFIPWKIEANSARPQFPRIASGIPAGGWRKTLSDGRGSADPPKSGTPVLAVSGTIESKGGRMGTTNAVFAFIGSFGNQEILLCAIVALLLFGGKKIPELAKGLGAGIRNFKEAMKSEDEEKKQ